MNASSMTRTRRRMALALWDGAVADFNRGDLMAMYRSDNRWLRFAGWYLVGLDHPMTPAAVAQGF